MFTAVGEIYFSSISKSTVIVDFFYLFIFLSPHLPLPRGLYASLFTFPVTGTGQYKQRKKPRPMSYHTAERLNR